MNGLMNKSTYLSTDDCALMRRAGYNFVFSFVCRSVKAKVDTGLGGQSGIKIKEVAPLVKGHGVLAVAQMASENKKELKKKMKVIQVLGEK